MKCDTPSGLPPRRFRSARASRRCCCDSIERIDDRLRHYDLPREMQDRLHAVLADDVAHRLVGDVRFDRYRAPIDRPCESGDQIVHHHPVACIKQRQHRMAADIVRAPVTITAPSSMRWSCPLRGPSGFPSSTNVQRIGVAALGLDLGRLKPLPRRQSCNERSKASH